MDQGAAYLFARTEDAGLWAEQQKFLAGDGRDSDFFGISAALNGDSAVVGAIRADVAGNEGRGRAHFFSRERGYFGFYLPVVAGK